MDYKRILKNIVPYLALVVLILLMVRLFQPPWRPPEPISYNEFLQNVQEQKIAKVFVQEFRVRGLYKDSATAATFPDHYDFTVNLPWSVDRMYDDIAAIEATRLGKDAAGVSVLDYSFKVDIAPVPQEAWWMSWLPLLVMVVLLGVFWVIIMRQQSGGGNKVMSFGRSRARLHVEGKNKITFADVAGADEEKEELREIVEFLKDPRRFLDLGARIPKGVLLVGPPGTGKTYLAKAVAGEASVPFFSISGSDFVEMFVGVGASRVRDLFDQAKKNAPSIVFIDEIDAVGRQRGAGLGGGHDEREQTLNQLLVEMDGFETNHGVIIIAATNRADILDPALLRPGRFDRQITVGRPDVKAREAILRVHARNKPLAPEVDLSVIARRTPFFTAADLENTLNEGALLAARNRHKQIGMAELEEAITRVMIGPEKKSRVVTEKDKNLVAYHEAGHAIVAYHLPGCDKVHEVSIIPRGAAGGYTMTLPDEERTFISRAKLVDRICEAMGGHAAEMMALGDVSTGSTSDLQAASNIARSMITEYGMSDELGPVYLGGGREVFIGRDLAGTRNYSESVAAIIDREMKQVLEHSYAKATQILSDNRDKLDFVVKQLLDKEKLDGVEFRQLMEAPLPL